MRGRLDTIANRLAKRFAGKMMPTIKDVARAAGVSVATVSAVANGTKYVSEPLARRVRHAIDGDGLSAAWRCSQPEERNDPDAGADRDRHHQPVLHGGGAQRGGRGPSRGVRRRPVQFGRGRREGTRLPATHAAPPRRRTDLGARGRHRELQGLSAQVSAHRRSCSTDRSPACRWMLSSSTTCAQPGRRSST